jgi:hypothetical protein
MGPILHFSPKNTVWTIWIGTAKSPDSLPGAASKFIKNLGVYFPSQNLGGLGGNGRFREAGFAVRRGGEHPGWIRRE